MKGFKWIQNRLALRISAVVMVVIVLLSAGYVFLQVSNVKTAAKGVITSYGIRMADSYSKKLDTAQLEPFLKNPQENDKYWSIRQELNLFREQIGALYVYIVRIDESQRPLIVIDGQPKGSESASPINEVTDIPEDAVQALLTGGTASSPIIDNPQYGKYISSYAPIRRADGTMIGVLGIDTDAAVTDSIAGDMIRQSIPFYLMMAVITILSLVCITWVLIRSFRPLKWIAGASEQIAVGELADANRLLMAHPVRSSDEIGAVYQTMVKMSVSLNTIIGRIVSNVAQTSEQLVNSSDQFASDAQHVLEINTKANRAVGQVAEGAQAQSMSSDESSRSMEEITTAIQRISEASLTAADASQKALENAESGKLAIHQMNLQIHTISSAAGEAVQRVGVLQGYSQEIESALSGIAEIANQTKLLALNASIEAARAGEHGAGFAVVAGEIRKLAENASGSALRIGELLHNVQNESQRISEAMNKGSEEVQTGTVLSEKAEEYLTLIVEKFRFVADQIHDISAATEQISAGSEEVAASVIGIADIAKASSDQTRQIRELTDIQLDVVKQMADSAIALNEITQDMREAIKQIKV
ncbi:methyl-accepting chemotaxis protein [Paenibacillus sp. UNC451MF]|uniref:methyl-accepting chemotaxis protein n=1 Tax=Paenibacillus sp. UNC451MF TaxID=1449063 RepID=UPI00048BC4A5|nr:HAMP domain-containing methyl-accepting chemotaxis protein [Paenibacillus sp. UNC451MF]